MFCVFEGFSAIIREMSILAILPRFQRALALGCLVVIMLGVSSVMAQDLFIKPKGQPSAPPSAPPSAESAAPNIFITPPGVRSQSQSDSGIDFERDLQALQSQPNTAGRSAILGNAKLQELRRDTARKIKQREEWNKPLKTPEDYMAYAALSRSITQAQNLERREESRLQTLAAEKQRIASATPSQTRSKKSNTEKMPTENDGFVRKPANIFVPYQRDL